MKIFKWNLNEEDDAWKIVISKSEIAILIPAIATATTTIIMLTTILTTTTATHIKMMKTA